MVDFKKWNLKDLGYYVVLTVVVLILVLLFMEFIIPVVKIIPLFSGITFTLTDILLLFIVLLLIVK